MPSNPDIELKLVELDELRRGDRRNAISRVASIIGHLVGTPLNVIAGRAALIRANAQDPASVLDDVARIERQVEQLTTRLRGLIEFLSVPEEATEHDAASTLLNDAIALYEPIAHARGSTLERGAGLADDAQVDRGVLYGVLTCLLSLATEHAARGSPITLNIERLAGTIAGQGRYGYACFVLAARGLDLRSPQKLDRISIGDAVPIGSLDAQQIIAVCGALADRAGGRLEVASEGGIGQLRLSWPCSS